MDNKKKSYENEDFVHDEQRRKKFDEAVKKRKEQDSSEHEKGRTAK